MSSLSQFPFLFWVSLFCLAGVVWVAWNYRHRGWGYPAIAVCLTVAAWYHGDAVYNGYEETYITGFPASTLNAAWFQVCAFALSFGLFMRFLPDLLNRAPGANSSCANELLSGRRSLSSMQRSITELAYVVAGVWTLLFIVALWRTDGEVLGLLAPYLGRAASPWARGQISETWFDSVASLLGIIGTLCAALFGVCAATLQTGWARVLVIALMFVTWPGYLLDRTRNTMLLILLPGLLAYVFLRLRGNRILQFVLLLLAFLGVNFWFKFVIANRSQTSIVSALRSGESRVERDVRESKHEGLNMFEELCWVNYLTDSGLFSPTRGQLYLANLANPIPRAWWPGKPTIGLDYAIARGAGGDDVSGVNVTIAVGMIGSGLVNFGKFLGPIAAAFLMALWCAFLARLDLTGWDFGRFLIYLVGMVSIFNFGRDITLLVAYPTLFGFGLLLIYRKLRPHRGLATERAGDGPPVVTSPKRSRGRRIRTAGEQEFPQQDPNCRPGAPIGRRYGKTRRDTLR